MHGAEHGDVMQLHIIYMGVIKVSRVLPLSCVLSPSTSQALTSILGSKIVLILNYCSLGLKLQFVAFFF